MIWVALEILYRTHYKPKFQKKLCDVSFSENRSTQNSGPRRVWKNNFKYSHLKEQEILSKIRGCPTLHDVPLQSYKHKKKQKNCKIGQKLLKIG